MFAGFRLSALVFGPFTKKTKSNQYYEFLTFPNFFGGCPHEKNIQTFFNHLSEHFCYGSVKSAMH